MRNPIKFYSASDMSIFLDLPKALELVRKLDLNKRRYTLNEILELRNVSMLVDAKVYPKSWSKDEKDDLINSKGVLKRVVYNYFKGMDRRNFARRAAKLSEMYQEDFLKLYGTHKLADTISEKQFIKVVEICKIPLYKLLRNKYIVSRYGDYLKKRLLSSPSNAEILLDAYVINKRDSGHKLNIPESISKNEKSDLIKQYIDSESPNYNYLQHIDSVRNDPKKLSISDSIRLEAKKRLETEKDKIFATSSNEFSWEYRIAIDEEQAESVIAKSSDGSTDISYSGKWLKENMDSATILNNFIHVFEFVDQTMRIELVSHPQELGLFESIGRQAMETYQTGVAFDSKQRIANFSLHAYYNFLSDQGGSLEEAIKWFYSTHIKQEFDIDNFAIEIPSEGTTYLEKCKLVVTELESVAKQYAAYVQYGEIDHELLSVSSQPIGYRSIPSLMQNKYIYPKENNQDIKRMLHYLLSDQSGLGYIREGLSEPTLLDLLNKNSGIKYQDFANYDRDNLKYLIKHKLLQNNAGIISVGDKIKVKILSDIYQNEFMVYPKMDEATQKEIDLMVSMDNLSFEPINTLLSFQEANYFDYNLNKSFVNGLDLRNSYSHGNQSSFRTEMDHKENYIILLKLLMLLTIKINDELCYIDDNKELADEA